MDFFYSGGIAHIILVSTQKHPNYSANTYGTLLKLLTPSPIQHRLLEGAMEFNPLIKQQLHPRLPELVSFYNLQRRESRYDYESSQLISFIKLLLKSLIIGRKEKLNFNLNLKFLKL